MKSISSGEVWLYLSVILLYSSGVSHLKVIFNNFLKTLTQKHYSYTVHDAFYLDILILNVILVTFECIL